MNRLLTIAFALIAGLVGGLVTRYIAPPTALAQNQAPGTKEIRAERFTLVDGRDRTVGTFMVEPEVPSVPDAGNSTPATDSERRLRAKMKEAEDEARAKRHPRRIVLVDPNGREIWSAGGNVVRPLSENIR
jgi:hypothetical protein